MAQYIARFRTNYFKVKDEAAFRNWVESLISDGELSVLEDGDGAFGVGGFCTTPYDRTVTDEDIVVALSQNPSVTHDSPKDTLCYYDLFQSSIDFAQELSEHLADGEVAVVQEVGWEKLDLRGFAYAINHRGEVFAEVNINNLPPY